MAATNSRTGRRRKMILPAAAQPDDDEMKKSRNHFCISVINAMGVSSMRKTDCTRLASAVTILFGISPSPRIELEDRRYEQKVISATSESSGDRAAVTILESFEGDKPAGGRKILEPERGVTSRTRGRSTPRVARIRARKLHPITLDLPYHAQRPVGAPRVVPAEEVLRCLSEACGSR